MRDPGTERAARKDRQALRARAPGIDDHAREHRGAGVERHRRAQHRRRRGGGDRPQLQLAHAERCADRGYGQERGRPDALSEQHPRTGSGADVDLLAPGPRYGDVGGRSGPHRRSAGERAAPLSAKLPSRAGPNQRSKSQGTHLAEASTGEVAGTVHNGSTVTQQKLVVYVARAPLGHDRRGRQGGPARSSGGRVGAVPGVPGGRAGRGPVGSERSGQHVWLSPGSAAKPCGEEGVGHDEGCSSAGDELGFFEDIQSLPDRGGIGQSGLGEEGGACRMFGWRLGEGGQDAALSGRQDLVAFGVGRRVVSGGSGQAGMDSGLVDGGAGCVVGLVSQALNVVGERAPRARRSGGRQLSLIGLRPVARTGAQVRGHHVLR